MEEEERPNIIYRRTTKLLSENEEWNMNQQEQSEIARRVLEVLYDAWEGGTHMTIGTVQDKGEWDFSVFRTAVRQLEEKGLIRTISYECDITPAGILYAEEAGIVPKHRVERHRKIRQHILTVLGRYDRRNNQYRAANLEEIARGVPDGINISKDLSLLNDLQTISIATSNSYRINEIGLRTYPSTAVDWRAQQVGTQTLDRQSADFLIVWDPDVVGRHDYAFLITALGDLVRSEGGLGVERIAHAWVGIPVTEGLLV